MAQLAGALEIQIYAEMARLRDDMNKATGIVQKASKSIDDAASAATKALRMLGIGVSVVGFANLIKGSIDAMDHLNDLSKSTGLTVETLAGLKVAAKQSGGDMDSVAAAVNKLSLEMGKAPEKFKALGISATDKLEAFKQFADVINGIENPQLKAAVAAEGLGKAWAGSAPLIAEGSVRIQEMVEAGTKASGITTEMARKADELNDQLELLKAGVGGVTASLASELLPMLIKTTHAMTDAQREGESFWGSMIQGWRMFATGDDLQKSSAELVALTNALLEAENLLAASKAIGAKSDTARHVAEVAEIKERIKLVQGYRSLLDAPTAAAKSGGGIDPAVAVAAARQAKAFIDAAEIAARIKKEAADLARENADWALKSGARQFDEDMKNLDERRKATETIAAESIQLANDLEKSTAAANEQQRAAAAEVLQGHIDQGAGIADSLRSAVDLEAASYEERRTNLQLYLDSVGLQVTDANMVMENFQIQHEANMGSISAQAAVERKKFSEQTAMQQASSMIGILTNLTAAGAQKNREMFELNKLASIANAIMYTYEGANKALSMGPWGIPLAGLIIGLGLANVAQIASTSFGSGAASAGGGGPGVTPVNQVPAIPNAGAQGGGPATIVNLQIHGDTVSKKQMMELFDQINEQIKDGGRIIVA